MKKQVTSFTLALLVVLASVSLRKVVNSLAAQTTSSNITANVTAIGSSPMPSSAEVLSASTIGSSPAPPVPQVLSASTIGSSPAPPVPQVLSIFA